MFNRGMLFSIVYLIACATCFSDDDWCCRFEKARSQALKHAGPASTKESRHVHVVRQKVSAVTINSPVPRSNKRRRVRRMRLKKELPINPRRTSRKQVEDIVGKAQLARENGQLEHALRLYKLAEGMDPDSREVEKKISEIEREMN